ncbi:MAG: DUF3868 domain-containing protein [Rikenellaceae bacterium]|nr:DUF3868 domain-containing protein [Rikenellaceae bacterium]
MRYLTPVVIFIVTLTAGAVSADVLYGQASAGKFAGTIRVDNISLTKVGEELVAEMEIRLEAEAVNRRLGFTVAPYLVGRDTTAVLPTLTVEGAWRWRLSRRKARLDAGNVSSAGMLLNPDTLIIYRSSMPYRDWMEGASLEIGQIMESPAGKRQLYTVAASVRVGTETPQAGRQHPRLAFIVPREDSVRHGEITTRIYFPVGRAGIDHAFGSNGKELEALASAMGGVGEQGRITGISIEGFASPEGAFFWNDRLARGRANSLKDYIRQQFGLPGDLVEVGHTPEDWNGLSAAAETAGTGRRAEIEQIIETVAEPDLREEKLRRVDGGRLWRRLSDDIFPGLRRAECRIEYRGDRTGKAAGDLSLRELYLKAEGYGRGSAEYDSIVLGIIPARYPEHPEACALMAARQIERGELADALRNLDKAAGLPEAVNNLGAIYLLLGETARAREMFEKAAAGGVAEAHENLRELHSPTNP